MKKLLLFTFLFILSSIIIYPQWTNQNPVPDGNNLWSTFFVDDNTGWIVGEGIIMKTTNAGLDWIKQSGGGKSVHFVDQNTGWICGPGGGISKTTNGGENWFSLTSGTTEDLTDIDFYDADTGYVVGYGGTILKTTNGGTVWSSQSSGTTNYLTSVDFVDALVGYAIAGENCYADSTNIIKTTDGGINWVDKSVLAYGQCIPMYSVEFIDANTGFVGGSEEYSSPHIYKTTDGGDTWVLVLSWEKQVTNNEKQLDFYYLASINSIYFKDLNIGYAVGGMGSYLRSIYTTTDGGSNWILKHYGGEETGLLSVSGNSTGKGWAVGISGVIFITEDNGNSWEQILSGNFYDDIHSVFFIDENLGWAGGYRDSYQCGGNVILKTTNGGKIWETQKYLGGSGETTTSVYFINEDIGWSVGGAWCGRTTDGGENWIEMGGRGASSIFFIDQNTGWTTFDGYLSSENGIYKSTDGGITWVEKNSISSSSVYFSDINNGWAVGEGGSILKSNDSGETWVPKSSGTTEDFTSMTFTNSTTIWIAGSNGKILSTTDTGVNWTPHDGVTTNNLTSLSFINENTGWISGLNGTMFKYSVEPPPPPVWSNLILVEDAGGTKSSGVLTFGQHIDGTDSIDTSLGEYELPPPPFTGNFDSRFVLPTNPEMGSLTDYRDSTLTEITWKMTFQPGIEGYPMTFSWDSTSFPEGTFYLKDRIDGSYVFINMKNQSSHVLTNPAITSLNISYRGNCSMVSVNNEWNMISVPLLAEDMELSNLFPTATSSAYGYDNGYVEEDTLSAEVGYWLKFGGNEDIQICGALLGDTVQVNEGWNMFGVYEEDVLVSQLTTSPPGIIATYLFGFEDSYYIADTLKSGKGYWVRVTENGVINLNGGALSKDGEQEQIARIDQDWGRIKITDSDVKSITLYATDEEIGSDFYELPPMPPTGIFDARYGNGKFVEALSSEKIIQISSDKYPITIRAEGLNITVRDRINGELLNEELNNGEEIRITNNKITSIEVTGRVTGGLPVSYELYQNYPNPFNPSTTIKFAVPKESNVNLSIYNVLGELVSTLVNEQKKPGYYQYKFNASNLASGIYLYRIKAGDFVETKKMILMK